MFLGTLTLSLIVSFFLQKTLFQPYYYYHYEQNLYNIALEIEENINSPILQNIISDLDYENQVDIMIVDRRLNNPMFSRQQNSNANLSFDPEIHRLVSLNIERLETTYLFSTVDDGSSHKRLMFAQKLSNGSYCIITHPLEPLENNIIAIAEFHFLAGAIACLIGLFSTLIFANNFTKPIIEISNVTERLSHLDFDQNISYQSKDELGELASSINVLSSRLEENKLALKNEIEFQKVLSHNMSHELKTPISVMKGYLEGLKYDIVSSPEERKEYLDIVLDECTRMTQLIDRMLHLSKLTSFQEQGLHKDDFSSEEFIEDINNQCGALLKQHSIELQVDCSTEYFYGNQDLLVQAFSNFVSNAIKYGDHKTISATLTCQDDYQIFSLYNSGSVVSTEDIERVFSIFFMVDKARSRQSNSHGIGLAVTKTVAELHHGTAFCQQTDDGMIFTIKIPTNPD